MLSDSIIHLCPFPSTWFQLHGSASGNTTFSLHSHEKFENVLSNELLSLTLYIPLDVGSSEGSRRKPTFYFSSRCEYDNCQYFIIICIFLEN